MTAQEAYAELISIRKNREDGYLTHLSYGGKADEQEERTIKAYSVALNALEKQIPKKPVVVGEEYIFERDEWEKDYECPFCGNPYADDSFCSCCGQKLDWSEY